MQKNLKINIIKIVIHKKRRRNGKRKRIEATICKCENQSSKSLENEK